MLQAEIHPALGKLWDLFSQAKGSHRLKKTEFNFLKMASGQKIQKHCLK